MSRLSRLRMYIPSVSMGEYDDLGGGGGGGGGQAWRPPPSGPPQEREARLDRQQSRKKLESCPRLPR